MMVFLHHMFVERRPENSSTDGMLIMFVRFSLQIWFNDIGEPVFHQ